MVMFLAPPVLIQILGSPSHYIISFMPALFALHLWTNAIAWPRSIRHSMVLWWRYLAWVSNSNSAWFNFFFLELWQLNFPVVPPRCSRWLGLSNHWSIGQLDARTPPDWGSAGSRVAKTRACPWHTIPRRARNRAMSWTPHHSNQWKVWKLKKTAWSLRLVVT